MNILLIAPVSPGFRKNFPEDSFPIGMAYISAVLKSAGHTVHCVNCRYLDYPLGQHLRTAGQECEFELIGIGGMSFMLEEIEAVLKEAREVFPRARTVVGGSIITTLPDLALRELDADFGVIGEGEETIVELASALENKKDATQIPGLAILDRRKGTVHITDARCGPVNLDSLPLPDYEGMGFRQHIERSAPVPDQRGFNILDNPRLLVFHSARSCPYKCTFCYHYPIDRYRQRSAEGCFKEIDYLVENYGINCVFFMDELFFSRNNKDRLYQFCDYLKKRKLTWCCQLTVREITPDALNYMKQSGCVTICLGIEHVSEKILKSMNKGITLNQIEYALKTTYDAGININANIIIGDVEETEQTFTEALCWLMRNRHYLLPIIPMWVLPNSQLYLHAKKIGAIVDEIDFIRKSADLHMAKINVSRHLTDEEHKKMGRTMNAWMATSGQYSGFIENIVEVRKDEFDRPRHRVEAVCPHCGEKNVHPEIFFPGAKESQYWDSNYTLCCHECHRGYHVPNPVSWSEESRLPKRLFLTEIPIWRLMKLYIKNGGSLKELADAASSQND